MPIRRDKQWNRVTATLVTNVQNTVGMAGIVMQRTWKEVFTHASNRTNGGMSSAPGSPPGVKTGAGRRSIQVDVTSQRDRVRPRVRVGSNLVYMRVHEYGGVIVSKTGYLTVPLNVEAQRLRVQNKSLRSVPGLFTFRSRKGNLLLGKKTGKKGMLKPMFLLTKKVRMPARPHARPAVRKARPQIIALFSAKNLIGGLGAVR